jgi:intein/homing endonuclease
MKELFTLGELYISDFIAKDAEPQTNKVEMKLMLEDSGAVRLDKSAPLDAMYGKYWYRSGINATMRNELKGIVDSICSISKLDNDDLWIDIASNDGTLLSFVPRGIFKMGIDPADDTFKEEAKIHANIIIQDYFSAEVFKKSMFGELKAKIVTSIAMFYDLEHPDKFIQDVWEILEDEGIWVMQMSYTPLMLQQTAFDNICFKPDAFITGANKPISEINVGDEVIGKNGDYTKVMKKFSRPYKGEMIKIKALYLEEIECTPEHPILTTKDIHSTPKWVDAKDIKTGDYLLLPKLKAKETNRKIDLSKYNKTDSPNYRRGLKNLTLTNEILWMMGLYVAEGYINGRPTNLHINFSLNKNEKDYADKLKKVFLKIGYKTRIYESKVSEGMDVQISCTALARVFEEWFGKGALNKKIPDFIFNATQDITIPFLNGLVNGDGYIDNQVGLHSASKTLIYQVQLMLANLNAMTGFSYVKPYEREIRGGKVISKDSWQLRGKNKVLDKIFTSFYHNRRDSLRYYSDDNFTYVPISKIKTEHYDGIVYNIETEDNTYLVSNAIVHNCHEHLYYYSLFNIKTLLEKNGFKIMDCQLNDINGGSFRVYAMKYSATSKNFSSQPYRDVCSFRVNSILEYEKTLKLDCEETWKDFFNKINDLKDKTVSFIKQEKAKGKTVWGYGASTKGNTLLQYFKLDNTLIDGIAERSPAKFGLKTIGTNIPICSEEEMRKAKPDYLLVLPWHFINEFVAREADFLKNGGKFIVPCPKFVII